MAFEVTLALGTYYCEGFWERLEPPPLRTYESFEILGSCFQTLLMRRLNKIYCTVSTIGSRLVTSDPFTA